MFSAARLHAMTPTNPIELASAQVGGVVKLSLALGLSRGAVSQWKRVPAERVLDVERLSGVSRSILRPDLYPRERSEA